MLGFTHKHEGKHMANVVFIAISGSLRVTVHIHLALHPSSWPSSTAKFANSVALELVGCHKEKQKHGKQIQDMSFKSQGQEQNM